MEDEGSQSTQIKRNTRTLIGENTGFGGKKQADSPEGRGEENGERKKSGMMEPSTMKLFHHGIHGRYRKAG
ncbi:hypothetical protein Rhal01_03845 [Rubritalea halochordaticola]|uniref:Uncharacterized protein n=1 Tax=Rubritalea halochordaticola TaxID=714537 RepID=A0ABP9V6X5_9BACT